MRKYPELYLPDAGVVNNYHKLVISEIFGIEIVLVRYCIMDTLHSYKNTRSMESLLKLEDDLYYNVYLQTICNGEENILQNTINENCTLYNIPRNSIKTNYNTITKDEYIKLVSEGFNNKDFDIVYQKARKDILEPKFMNIFIDIFQDYISKDIKKIIDVTLNTNHKM